MFLAAALVLAAMVARAQVYPGQSGYTLYVLDPKIDAIGSAINARGDVAGSTTGRRPPTAFLGEGTSIKLLGTLGGSASAGVGISNDGRIAGYATTASGKTHAFVSNGGKLEDLGTLGGSMSIATAINAAGQVTGSSTTADGKQHVFVTEGATLIDLGALPGAGIVTPTAIDAKGEVTGIASYPDAPPLGYHVFVSRGEHLIDLGTLGGYTGVPNAINNRGMITGFSNTAAEEQHAFVSDGDALTDLGTLGGTTSAGYAINEAGQVAGYATTANGELHAFVSDASGLKDLGTAGYSGSVADSINNDGAITGYLIAGEEQDEDAAFLYRDGRLINLNHLLTPEVAALYALDEGVAINEQGDILIAGRAKAIPSSNVVMVLKPESVARGD